MRCKLTHSCAYQHGPYFRGTRSTINEVLNTLDHQRTVIQKHRDALCTMYPTLLCMRDILQSMQLRMAGLWWDYSLQSQDSVFDLSSTDIT